MLASVCAVVSLWVGAGRHSGPVARGYRWLGGAALFWFAGLIVAQVLAGSLTSSVAQPGLADVAPLLALASATAGIMVLAEGEKRSDSGSVLPGLADGYVMAVALLVIGWVLAFGSEFHHSNERPHAFLLNLLHPLADLAVLGALLPVLTVAWRRVLVPYVVLFAVTGADSVGVGARISAGHQGIPEQLAMVAAACLLGIAPWVESIAARFGLVLWRSKPPEPTGDAQLPGLTGVTRSPITSSGAATIIASAAAVVAAFVIVVSGLARAPASGLALVIAGGAAVFVMAIRILMLVRENGLSVRMWRAASDSLRDLADRTGDMVLICDIDGTISYASSLVSGFGYPGEALIGKDLGEFIHPEDVAAARAVVALVTGLPEETVAAVAAGPPEAPEAPEAAEAAATQENDGHFSCRVRAADGTWRHVECAVLLYRMPGEPARLLVSIRDMSEQVALRQQVTHLTFHDGLTGLPNRAYVEERAREALGPAADRRAGVIFLDIDGFAAVNDLIGHGAGDLVLAQAARRLRAVVPAQETSPAGAAMSSPS